MDVEGTKADTSPVVLRELENDTLLAFARRRVVLPVSRRTCVPTVEFCICRDARRDCLAVNPFLRPII